MTNRPPTVPGKALRRARRGAHHMIGAIMIAALATPAGAHVKWFTRTDVATPPLGLARVLTPLFLGVTAASVLLVFAGFVIDGWIARRWPGFAASGTRSAAMEERLIRAATGAYLLFISSRSGVILTPELRTPATWVAVLQFFMAMALIWRPTCLVAGAGLMVLYGYAIARYGLFHLVDYVFFPALAVYLGSLPFAGRRIAAWRAPLLTGALAFSLAWTGIEKFVYPQWTYAVVATHPSIAFGFDVPFVVVVAGFVEFTLAFYLVTGRGLVRLGAAAYALIFIAAMGPFGKIDVYGHMVIVATLAITMMRGTTRFQASWHSPRGGLVGDAGRITMFYAAALVLFFAGYYAMQRTVFM